MSVTFLLGAGFCLAANRERSSDTPNYVRGYPLAADLRSCFDSSYRFEAGIEEAFAEAESRRDPKPVGSLTDTLLEADHYFGWAAATNANSLYSKLVEAYKTSNFLTFNYDGLLEFSLLRAGLWVPTDGFGIPAEATVPGYYVVRPVTHSSACRVLHLHGSLYLYARQFDVSAEDKSHMRWITLRETPEFVFDGDQNTHHFSPFEKGHQDERYQLPSRRLIAPVPDKAPAIAQGFVREIYQRAREIASISNCLVSIGYSFSTTDTPSFRPILGGLPRGTPVLIVSGESTEISQRLARDFPALHFEPLAPSFEAWGADGFRIPDFPGRGALGAHG